MEAKKIIITDGPDQIGITSSLMGAGMTATFSIKLEDGSTSDDEFYIVSVTKNPVGNFTKDKRNHFHLKALCLKGLLLNQKAGRVEVSIDYNLQSKDGSMEIFRIN